MPNAEILLYSTYKLQATNSSKQENTTYQISTYDNKY